ncbi:hypothetical protein HHI36_001394, partial [Cryptolaemus montrouzieri]
VLVQNNSSNVIGGMIALEQCILKLEMEKEEVKTSNVNHVIVNGEESEEIITEILERQKRENNIIIANINELTGTNKKEREVNKLEKVRKILEDNDVKTGDYKVLRMGSYQQNKNRHIKIIFGNSSDVYEVLEKKKEISNKIPALNIFRDQTLKQGNYYKNIQSKLHELIASGDNMKTIRHINGRPTIVEKVYLQLRLYQGPPKKTSDRVIWSSIPE